MDSLSALRAHIAAFASVTLAKAAPPDFNQKHPHAPDGKFVETGDARKLSILVKPSGNIETFDQAVKWWSDNLGGKVAKLTAHIGRVGDGWKKTIPIQVDFPASETHAFTEKAGVGEEPDCYDDPRRKERPRVFVKNRALLMDGIVRAIEFPNVKAVQYGADLLFERRTGGNHYAIALMWSEARGLYVFDSAYSMTDKKMRDIIAHKDTRKNNGPLQKSEPSWSGHSVFRDSTESGSNPTGSKPETFESIGFRSCCNTTLVDLLLLGKSYIDLADDFDSLTKSYLTQDEVRAAAHSAVFRFPHEPTPAQIKAGNYQKRKVAWRGLTISIENEAGSVRRGVDRDGHAWETRMVFPYGYILSSLGVDGDHVDCYLGPEEDAPMVYVIHQRKAGNWTEWDEDKAMLQFASQDVAVHAYLLHYDDPRFLGPVTAMPVEEFKEKVLAANGRMVKSHVSGYTRGDGVYVAPHEDSRPKKKVPENGLSNGTLDWLKQWVFHHQAEEPTDEMIVEMTRYVPRGGVRVYRSHLEDKKKEKGQIESWTKDKDFADWLTENPEASGGKRFTKQHMAWPDEILIDLTMLPESLQGDQSVPGQQEVIALSGTMRNRMLAVRRERMGIKYKGGVPMVKSHAPEEPAPSSLSNERIMELAFDSLDFGQWMLAKSEHGPIPAGSHWIKSEVVTAALLHDFEQITRTYFSGSRSLVRKRIFGQSGCCKDWNRQNIRTQSNKSTWRCFQKIPFLRPSSLQEA